MNVQDLFDGEWWELEMGEDMFIPFLRVVEEVKIEGKQVLDEYDSGDGFNLFVVEDPALEARWHPEEQAWANFSVMLQRIAKLLPEGRAALVIEERVYRDDKNNVTHSRYYVKWKGAPL